MKKLKKKIVPALVAVLAVIMLFSSFALVGCGSQSAAPYIGTDGYWYVDGQKTDVYAKGEKGDKGKDGAKGDKGEDGAKGDKGEDGAKGDRGDKGHAGNTGYLINGEGDKYTKRSTDLVEQKGKVSPVNNFDDGNLSKKGKFYMDYATVDEALQAGHDLGVEIAAEGDVLLKNEGNALPLKSNEKNLTLLGIRSARMIRSGFGSGSGGGSAISPLLKNSLEKEGFKVNGKMQDFYTREVKQMIEDRITELNPASYSPSLVSTYAGYGDAAILTFSRSGAENYDVATHNALGHADPDDHGLQLEDNEKALVLHAKSHFEKVIVLINSSNIMQIPELVEYDATRDGNDYSVDAILWVGGVGEDGTDAIAKIFTGEVTPSGHTVDLWEKDFKKSPTWTNFGKNTQNKDSDGDRLDTVYYGPDGEITKFASLEYREGIYTGYKYYETRYVDKEDNTYADGDTDGYGNVLFPFGYGLSYTTFDWVLDGISETGNITAADSQIKMRVWVKNTGSVAGKDVVQLYYSAPYTKGGIEKAAVNLAGYGKTKLLRPGESDIVTITINAQDMASYDWNDANGNGFMGYELEGGDYKIVVAHDSHQAAKLVAGKPAKAAKGKYDEGVKASVEGFVVTRTVAADNSVTTLKGRTGIKCTTDLVTGKEIKNVYTGDFASTNKSLLKNMISRGAENGLTQPAAATKQDRTLDAATLADYNSQEQYFSYQDKATDPWYVGSVPEGWTQAADKTAKLTITLADMAGVAYTEPVIKNGVATWPANMTEEQKAANKKWEDFMNQFTWDELCELPTNANNVFKRLADVVGPNKYKADGMKYRDPDGPINAGKANMGGQVQFPSNPILAASFNKELAEDMGTVTGNIHGLENIPGWRGAGANIHRSPFSGRNFEYYSEDGVLSGIVGAAVAKGVTSKGVIAHFKHFYGNDQEAYRADYGGVFTWATEQVLREQTAKPFEYIVKYGGVTGLMNAFNRIGKWTQSTNYATHELLLNQEWDFKGSCEGDMWAKEFVPMNLAVRGGDEELITSDSSYPPGALERGRWDADANCVYVAASADEYTAYDAGNGTLKSPTHYFSVRKCAQRLLQSMANSTFNQNCYAQTEEVTYKLTKGIYNSIALSIPGKTADAQFSFDKEVVWPAGMRFDAQTGILSGTPTADTAADVAGKFECDGWINGVLAKNVKFKFEIQTDLRFNGKNIANNGTVNAKASDFTGSGVTIDAEQITYGSQRVLEYSYEWGGVVYNETGNVRFTNAYCYDGEWYHRDEDKSAADILTLGQVYKGFTGTDEQMKRLDNYNLYGFDVKGLPSGVTAEKVMTDELGWAGKSSYKVNTSLKLKGTIDAGTYNVTVTLNAPYVEKSTNPWMSPDDSMLVYTVSFKLVVA